jgi:hypothetical protein
MWSPSPAERRTPQRRVPTSSAMRLSYATAASPAPRSSRRSLGVGGTASSRDKAISIAGWPGTIAASFLMFAKSAALSPRSLAARAAALIALNSARSAWTTVANRPPTASVTRRVSRLVIILLRRLRRFPQIPMPKRICVNLCVICGQHRAPASAFNPRSRLVTDHLVNSCCGSRRRDDVCANLPT